MRMKLAAMFYVLSGLVIMAAEPGIPLFSDNFDTKGTFVENWKPQGKVENSDNVVRMVNGGSLIMNRELPEEFFASVKLTLQEPADKTKTGFAGFDVGDCKFTLRPDGLGWVVYRVPNQKNSNGAARKVDGFQFGKNYTLTLSRKKLGDSYQYHYMLDGQNIGTALLATAQDAKLQLFSYRETATFDDFQLSAIKKEGDDSPNLVVNSSFEHLQEGMPTYFDTDTSRKYSFNKPYENFLKTFAIDTAEKHSGQYALRLFFDESCSKQGFQTFDTGSVVGQPVTFSVWLKADRDKFPVSLTVWEMRTKWHKKEVMLTRDWARYDFTLPAATRSAIRVGVAFNTQGTVWADDLQVEIAAQPSPYKASNMDGQKFSAKTEATVALPPMTVPKLIHTPALDGNLDSWKNEATMIDRFYYKEGTPQEKTQLFLGCNEESLFLGIRAYAKDLALVKPSSTERDSFQIFGQDHIEIFLDPGRSKKNFYQLVVSAAGSQTDVGLGRNLQWNGSWTAFVNRNEKENSIDYVVKIPLAMLAAPGIAGGWGINVGRYNSVTKEADCLMPYPTENFQKVALYPILQLPPEVLRPYALGCSSVRISPSKDGQFQLSGVIENNTEATINGSLAALAADGSSSLSESALTINRGNTPFSLTVPAGDYRNSAVIMQIKSAERMLCRQSARPEEFAAISICSKYNYYMDDPEAEYRITCSLSNPETLTARLQGNGINAEKTASAQFTMKVPLDKLPEGTHQLKLVFYNKESSVAEAPVTLVKKASRSGAVRINQFRRCLVVDGKKILPFAPLINIWPNDKDQKKMVDFLVSNGFKYAMIVISRNATDNAEKFLEEAEKNNIQVIYWNNWKRPELTDEQIKAETEALQRFRCIIAQLIVDEPELHMKSDETKALLDKMRPLFPYQPVFMNNTVMGIPNRFADLNTDILMLDDYLTNRENRTVKEIVDQVDIMWSAGKTEHKPCYYFLVGNNMHNHYREPTAAEQYAETYGSLAANCTGFAYFMGIPSYPAHWQAYLALNRELLSLSDIILSDEEVPEAQISDATLRQITRRHGDDLYVIVVNTGDHPAENVVITLPGGLSFAPIAEVMFEDRNIQVDARKIVDRLPALSRHIYKFKIDNTK